MKVAKPRALQSREGGPHARLDRRALLGAAAMLMCIAASSCRGCNRRERAARPVASPPTSTRSAAHAGAPDAGTEPASWVLSRRPGKQTCSHVGEALWARSVHGTGIIAFAPQVAVAPGGRMLLTTNVGDTIFAGVSEDGTWLWQRDYHGEQGPSNNTLASTPSGAFVVQASQPYPTVQMFSWHWHRLGSVSLRRFAAPDGPRVSVSVGRSGHVAVAGPVVTASERLDFVALLDKQLHPLWSHAIHAVDKIVAGDGDVFVLGTMAHKLTLGQRTVTAQGRHNVYVAKLDLGGDVRWVDLFPDRALQDDPVEVDGAALDRQGDLVVAGTYWGTLTFGGLAPIRSQVRFQKYTPTLSDVFVAKLDPNGKPLWARSFGDKSAQGVRDVAVDARGNIVLVGGFDGSIDFGGGALHNPDGATYLSRQPGMEIISREPANAVFVAVLSPTGTHIWSRGLGNKNEQGVTQVVADESGNFLIAGWFSGRIAFGDGSSSSRTRRPWEKRRNGRSLPSFAALVQSGRWACAVEHPRAPTTNRNLPATCGL